jgi:hypothetical protein
MPILYAQSYAVDAQAQVERIARFFDASLT